MELVDGATLAERLAPGPLPLEDARAIARQIAEALEAAHEKGIIHRDLKPANIKVADDGTVKVLDFGLAKALDSSASSASNASNSPTLTARGTEIGMILGTAAYMAPEQARGRAVDKRADIWAFGVVLFEMLSGRRLFDGEEISDVMASVLRQEIDWSRLPAEHRRRSGVCSSAASNGIRNGGCATSARRASRSARRSTNQPSRRLAAARQATLPRRGPTRSTRLPWAIAIGATLIAIALAAALVMRRPTAPSDTALLLEIGPPPDQEFVVGSNTGAVIISPDGSTVAFLTQTSEGRRLNVRSLATGETRALPAPRKRTIRSGRPTAGRLASSAAASCSRLPSPAGARGHHRYQPGTRRHVVGRGRHPVHTCRWRCGASRSGRGRRQRAGHGARRQPRRERPLLAGRAARRPEVPVLHPQHAAREQRHLPRFARWSKAGPPGHVAVERFVCPPRGDRPGHLLWVRDDDLFAQPLDIDAGRLTGEVKSVASDVRVEESQRGTFASVSDAGRLVWASARGGDFNFSWYERNGHRLGDLPIERKDRAAADPPDGRKLAFTRAVGGTADIWVHDLASAATTQVTTDPEYDENPSWSPDGRRLIYQGRPDDTLLVATLDGSSPILKVPGGSRLTGGGFMPTEARSMFSRLTARLPTTWQSLTSIVRTQS